MITVKTYSDKLIISLDGVEIFIEKFDYCETYDEAKVTSDLIVKVVKTISQHLGHEFKHEF